MRESRNSPLVGLTLLAASLLFLTPGRAQASCAGPGPCWADLQVVNIGGNSAPGRTGQWWCTNHFGGNVGGAWECVEGTGSSCSAQVPINGNVQCGRLYDDGSTPYTGELRSVAPFGYGRVEHVLVQQSAPGRTGDWWCTMHFGGNLGGYWKCREVSGASACSTSVPNGELVSCSKYADVQSVAVHAPAPGRTGNWWCTMHFGGNLGGSWDCLGVSGGTSCAADAPAGASVTCGRFTPVDETPFAPAACSGPDTDPAEAEFCNYTEYMTTRTARAMYLFNDFLRAGFNRSFGGALFELYGADKRNRIEEHGGSAAQLSIWGYDQAAAGTGWFTTITCDSHPYSNAASCAMANGDTACQDFAANGAQISDCATELPCSDWTAGGPWNPIQAQAVGCGWNGPTNDVSQVLAAGTNITFVKDAPYHFTKTTSFVGLTWQVTGQVLSDRPYLKATYQMSYASARGVGEHNQEIPAIFTDATINHWYFFYSGASPYTDVNGQVTRLRSDFGSELRLPGRQAPLPQPTPSLYHDATEEWMTVCDRMESQCLTLASFSPDVKVFSQGGQYVTALGRFGLGTSFNRTWDVYFFPYRYDEVVAGKSVRQWIYDLKQGL